MHHKNDLLVCKQKALIMHYVRNYNLKLLNFEAVGSYIMMLSSGNENFLPDRIWRGNQSAWQREYFARNAMKLFSEV